MTVRQIYLSLYGMLHYNWERINPNNVPIHIDSQTKYLIHKEYVGNDMFVYEVEYYCKNCGSYKYFTTIETHVGNDITNSRVTETSLKHLYNEISKLVNND